MGKGVWLVTGFHDSRTKQEVLGSSPETQVWGLEQTREAETQSGDINVAVAGDANATFSPRSIGMGRHIAKELKKDKDSYTMKKKGLRVTLGALPHMVKLTPEEKERLASQLSEQLCLASLTEIGPEEPVYVALEISGRRATLRFWHVGADMNSRNVGYRIIQNRASLNVVARIVAKNGCEFAIGTNVLSQIFSDTQVPHPKGTLKLKQPPQIGKKTVMFIRSQRVSINECCRRIKHE